MMANWNRQTWAHGIVNVWERMPYIYGEIGPPSTVRSSHCFPLIFTELMTCVRACANNLILAWALDAGLVRNLSKADFNSTDTMPSLQQFEAGFSPAFSPAPPGVGSVVSPFRRVHKVRAIIIAHHYIRIISIDLAVLLPHPYLGAQNFFLANYNSLASVLLDDGGSRMLMYNNYMAFGAWGVGESCHESQWVYGVGNLYAYASAGGAGGGGPVIIHNEGPSPLGIRTFFYNDTFLLALDSTWCDVYGSLNLVRWGVHACCAPHGEV